MKHQFNTKTHRLVVGARWQCSASGDLYIVAAGNKTDGPVSRLTRRARVNGKMLSTDVVKLRGPAPDARCLYHLIRGWWRMQSTMKEQVFFVVEGTANGFIVYLNAPGSRTGLARMMTRHGVTLSGTESNAEAWEDLAIELCQFLLDHTVVDQPREIGEDGCKQIHGYDAYRNLVLKHLTNQG